MKKLLIGLLALGSISSFANSELPYITDLECTDGVYDVFVSYYGQENTATIRLYVSNELVFSDWDQTPEINSSNEIIPSKDLNLIRFTDKVTKLTAIINTNSNTAKLNISLSTKRNKKQIELNKGSMDCTAKQVQMH